MVVLKDTIVIYCNYCTRTDVVGWFNSLYLPTLERVAYKNWCGWLIQQFVPPNIGKIGCNPKIFSTSKPKPLMFQMLQKQLKSRTFCAVATGKTTIGCTSRRIWGALALAAAKIPWDFHKLSSWSTVGRCLQRSQAYPARFSPKLIVGTSIMYGCTVHTAYQLGFKPFYREFSRILTTIFNSKDLFDPFLYIGMSIRNH